MGLNCRAMSRFIATCQTGMLMVMMAMPGTGTWYFMWWPTESTMERARLRRCILTCLTAYPQTP